MKVLFILAAFLFISLYSQSQTAVDFTCNDCDGLSHTFFHELDSGKVVVLCWVMPCSSCVGPSLTTSLVVKSFDTVQAGRVRMYLVDDYANTSCSSLKSWAAGNNIKGTTNFSDASIKMSDYGTVGMPKIVVVGGKEHKVFYNAVSSVDATALKDSIQSAINSYSTGIAEQPASISGCSVFPNPSSSSITVSFRLEKPCNVTLELLDQTGRMINRQILQHLPHGENHLRMPVADYPAGVYLLRVSDEKSSVERKVLISR